MKSEELFKKSKIYMPGGVNSPVRAFKAVGRNPVFIDHAKGDKIYDVDGNEYIDYVLSWGPNILGSSEEHVVNAVKAAVEKGLTYGAPTENELVLAELIQKLVPSMEMIRLVNSGTEATMSAIRAARGFTKKNKLIKFRGCYHGHSDGLLVQAGSGALTQNVPDSAGVPASCVKDTLVADYNDISSVEKLFEEFPDDIAAIIVEPVAANMGVVLPEDGFLQALRDITEKHDSLLIFDEVITGFRIASGGAEEVYGVHPDLKTFGKIVGGGMPLAVYGGRRDIMECVAPDGPVYQAGTLSGNPIATTAGIATLKIIDEKKDEIYPALEKKTKRLAEHYRKCFDGIANVNQIGSLMSVFFTKRHVTNYSDAMSCDTELFSKYFNFMLNRRIYVAPSQFEAMFLSVCHSDEDIDRTCEAVTEFAETIE